MSSQNSNLNVKLKKGVTGWSFVTVAVLLAVVFSLYPVINSLFLSTISGKGVVYEFVGFGNIKRLFYDANFKTALKNTFV